MIVGRLIPAGTGLTYHSQRRRNASGLTESEMAALSGPVTAEAVAEGGEAESESSTEQ